MNLKFSYAANLMQGARLPITVPAWDYKATRGRMVPAWPASQVFLRSSKDQQLSAMGLALRGFPPAIALPKKLLHECDDAHILDRRVLGLGLSMPSPTTELAGVPFTPRT